MKKFVLELIEVIVLSMVAGPFVLISMQISGTLWEDKIEPWLNKFNKS